MANVRLDDREETRRTCSKVKACTRLIEQIASGVTDVDDASRFAQEVCLYNPPACLYGSVK